MQEEKCIFCDIVSGAVPSDVVYTDQYVVAFSDLHPKARIHKLIVPRLHIATLNDVCGERDAILLHMFKVVQELAKRYEVAQSGYRTAIHCQKGGGQEIFHLHIHLLAN